MDALLDEVESLEAILMDDVYIRRNAQSNIPELIEYTVYPMREDEEQQYVCVTLQVIPKIPGYPDLSPDFKLIKPRGLDDFRLESIRTACLSKLQESLGFSVVFDLIEVVREYLTDTGNLPSGECVVCLYGFSEGDEFTRTECFHYLHSYCLARHLNAMRRNYQEEHDKLPAWQQKTAAPFKAHCPVCRENIGDETDSLKCAMPPSMLQNAPEFELTKELRELQKRMSALFLQQKSRGAIIDAETESVGTVISIETEEEVQRRLQRAKNVAAATVSATENNGCLGGEANHCLLAESVTETGSNTLTDLNNKPSCSSIKNGTTFAPVVQQTQRNDPTNNNYHHNRRHCRGGRRHQHHHHHRERDRERYEHHHVPASTANNDSAAASGGSGSTSANATTAAVAGKQTKQTACGASFR